MAGAAHDGDAHRAARQVADSLLVKCSLNGADPYWGRVVSELGTAGVAFELGPAVGRLRRDGGLPPAEWPPPHDAAAAAAHLAGRHVGSTATSAWERARRWC